MYKKASSNETITFYWIYGNNMQIFHSKAICNSYQLYSDLHWNQVRQQKADTASYNMLLSFFLFRIKTKEEEQSEKLTNAMKLFIFLSVTLGTLVTGLDSVSFEINEGGCSWNHFCFFDYTCALDRVLGFQLEFSFLLPLHVHVHLLHIYLQETFLNPLVFFWFCSTLRYLLEHK